MPVKWGFGGRGPVAIVTDGVNNSAKQFLSVSVITGGTNKNVSNNVKNFPFWRYHTTLSDISSYTTHSFLWASIRAEVNSFLILDLDTKIGANINLNLPSTLYVVHNSDVKADGKQTTVDLQ